MIKIIAEELKWSIRFVNEVTVLLTAVLPILAVCFSLTGLAKTGEADIDLVAAGFGMSAALCLTFWLSVLLVTFAFCVPVCILVRILLAHFSNLD